MVEHRSPKPGVGGSIPFAPAICAKVVVKVMIKKIKIFTAQVIAEAKKISWASRKETVTSVVVVLVMVILASAFFVTIDYASFHVVNWLLELGR